MKMIIHKKNDALYLRLDDTTIIESEEVSDGIILDYNAEGKVVGIEVLYAQSEKPKFITTNSSGNNGLGFL